MEHVTELLHEAEFWVLVGFVLFMIVALNPLRKLINAQVLGHISKIQAILRDAETLRRDAEDFLAKAQKQQNNIEAECEAILNRTEQEALALINKAEIECERIVAVHRAAAQEKIALAHAQARAELKLQAAQLVMEATSDVMKKQMEGRLASALIDQAIGKIPAKLSS